MARRISRRAFLRAVPGAALGMAACGWPSGLLSRSGACRLGVAATHVAPLERQLGGRLGMERIYHRGEEWPNRRERRAIAGGRVPFSTFKSLDGPRRYTWAEVAEGAFDATLRRVAGRVSALEVPIYVDYHAEPEAEEGVFGNRSDFVAAFRRVVEVFRARRATNVRWGWCLMGFHFTDHAEADSWYPGDEYVDVVAADAYNWANCTESGAVRSSRWTSFASRFGPAMDYAKARGRPFIAAEVGCPEDPSDGARKAEWIREMGDYVKTRPHVRGVCWFHHGRSDGFRCDWWIDSSASSLRAFRRLMRDPYFAVSA